MFGRDLSEETYIQGLRGDPNRRLVVACTFDDKSSVWIWLRYPTGTPHRNVPPILNEEALLLHPNAEKKSFKVRDDASIYENPTTLRSRSPLRVTALVHVVAVETIHHRCRTLTHQQGRSHRTPFRFRLPRTPAREQFWAPDRTVWRTSF
jgi:hypothetical protein